MKKLILLPIFLLSFTLLLNSQDDIIQVSIGNNYSNQVYYTLNNDEVSMLGNDTWDIAFALTSSFEAGIHVNESVTISFVGESPSTLLFKAPSNDFSMSFGIEEIGDSLYNDESSWAYGGALNIQADSLDFADFGWGSYNPANHAIEGNRVFAIKLRDNSFKKFMIESLISGVYTIKYADLDGSNEQSVTLAKADFEGQHLILFSFLTGAALEEQPTSWDLSFQRYSDLDPSNVGINVEYTVTGILTAPGVLSAQADDANPDDIDFEPYLSSLSGQLDIIGQDWKYFSFDTGWNIIDDRVFFVKTSDNNLWQIYMYDFEGSSTGTYTFAKWDLGEVASVDNPNSTFSSVSLFPNPINTDEKLSLVIEQKESTPVSISIINQYGQMINSFEKELHSGLNALSITTENLSNGNYFVVIRTKNEQIARKVTIQ